MNALKCRSLGIHNARLNESWKAHMLYIDAPCLKSCVKSSQVARYNAGSAIALTGAVRMLVLPHAVTAGASLYIEQEN